MATSNFEFSRRKFLKTAGILTALSNSTINFFTKAFGQANFDIEAQQRLNVTGIYPNPKDVGTSGIHLRWLFPLTRGFPDSFDIYRCESSSCILENSIEYSSIENYAKIETIGNEKYFVFKKPFQYCSVLFKSNLDAFNIKVYYENIVLGEQRVISKIQPSVEFQYPLIDVISLPVGVDFDKITIIYPENSCGITGWKRINTINYKDRFINFNVEKFFEGCYNFYLPKNDERKNTIEKYKTFISKKYYEGLIKVLSNITLPVGKVKNYYPSLNMLLLSIIDPNISRLLGLYYIDNNAIQATNEYSYKIIANYSDGEKECGSVFNLGKNYDPLPTVADLNVSQSDEAFFAFDQSLENYEQQGASVLKWLKPVYNLKTDAASYFLVKSSNKLLSIQAQEKKINNRYLFNNQSGQLIIPAEDREDNRYYNFHDRNVKVEQEDYDLNYRIYGVDVYGRIGEPKTSAVKIADKSSPPAPVNLRIKERRKSEVIDGKTTEVLHTYLQFSYSPHQYLKGPDAAKFVIYKRNHSLNLKQRVSFSLQESSENFKDALGSNIFRIKLEDFQIKDFGSISGNLPYKYFQFAFDRSGKKLSAKERKKFRIRSILNEEQIEIETDNSYMPTLTSGRGFLFANTAVESGWSNLKNVDFTFPVELNLTQNAGISALLATVICFRTVDIPIYDDAEGSPATKTCTEIYLNRALFESGIFNEGKIIRNGSEQLKIIAQASVYASKPSRLKDPDIFDCLTKNGSNTTSKLLIEGAIAFSQNEKIVIYPDFSKEASKLLPQNAVNTANDIGGLVKISFSADHVPIEEEGELLLPAQISKDIEGQAEKEIQRIPITAKLLSDIRSPYVGAHAEALIYISKKVNKIFLENSKAFYFKTYEVDITDHAKLIFQGGKGSASAYFAVQTIDNSRQQNKSPLSLPVQHIDYLKEIPPTPSAVVSCSAAASDGKNYLSLPNREGRSTVCLQWDAVKDETGNVNRYIRYELSRALDVSIISVFRNKWMVNDPMFASSNDANSMLQILNAVLDTSEKEILVKNSINVKYLKRNIKTGIYEAELSDPTSITEDDKLNFAGARTLIAGKYFSLSGFAGSILFLRLLTPVENGIADINSAFNLNVEALPDLFTTTLVNDIDKLKKIAERCPEAFSMVIKVPVRENKFTDNVPGQGNGKYFYKVRSVDAAENRSEWSVCSEAFHQVDIKLPDAPLDFNAEIGDRQARLVWRNTFFPKTEGYEIFNLETLPDEYIPMNFSAFEIFKKEGDENIAFNNPFQRIGRGQLILKKIVARAGFISIPANITIPIKEGIGDITERVNSTIESLNIKIETLDNPTNLFSLEKFEIVSENLNDSYLKINKIKIKDKEAIKEDVSLKITIGDITLKNDPTKFEFVDAGLVGGNKYLYAMRAVNNLKYLLNGEIKEITAKGKGTAIITIVGIDKSIPSSPSIESATWEVDTRTAHLFIKSNIVPKNLLILIRKDNAMIWNPANTNYGNGWIDWLGNENTNNVLVLNVDDNVNTYFQVQIKTTDKRVSDFSNEMMLNKLQ